jgi:hypothetical protein
MRLLQKISKNSIFGYVLPISVTFYEVRFFLYIKGQQVPQHDVGYYGSLVDIMAAW